jgi:ammonia channel protein AmtB
MKNMVDVIFGGLTFWMFGYAFLFGEAEGSNWFCGLGDYLLIHNDVKSEGDTMAKYFFQSSFATTAATIVSGKLVLCITQNKVHSQWRLIPYLAQGCNNRYEWCTAAMLMRHPGAR